jgi:HEAT repeat protein
MNPTVLGGAASLLLLVLWWSGRRRPVQLLRSTDASAIAALNRCQIAALRSPAPAAPQDAGSETPCPSAAALFEGPGQAVPHALLLRRLSAALTREPAIRLAALRYARAWGHRATVPLLLRGLRDSDPAVVREAALAIERFRCCPALAAGAPQTSAVPLPRNVARTR